jgi:late competence protein required for DNA uptake (superfamily II DNA/RNA helicase)
MIINRNMSTESYQELKVLDIIHCPKCGKNMKHTFAYHPFIDNAILWCEECINLYRKPSIQCSYCFRKYFDYHYDKVLRFCPCGVRNCN